MRETGVEEGEDKERKKGSVEKLLNVRFRKFTANI